MAVTPLPFPVLSPGRGRIKPRPSLSPRHTYIGSMTRLIALALILFTLALPAAAQDDVLARWEADHTTIFDAAEVDLDALQWIARPLVVFADSPQQPQFQEQMRLLQDDLSALDIRDVIIIVDTDPAARTAVRQDLRPRGFSLVLIDKDGRVNLRKPDPWGVREIVRQIDKMPIRLEEIEGRLTSG
jgi:hypothetical protein